MIRRTAITLAFAIAMVPPLAAQSPGAAPEVPAINASPSQAPRAPLPSDFAQLRAHDARVLEIGHRLVTANAPFCADRTHDAGLLLHDLSAYGDARELRSLLNLAGDIGVQALVPGGPAQRAGLRIDDTILAIGNLEIASIATDGAKSWERIETIRAQSERLLTESGSLTVTVARTDGPVEITISGAPSCRSRFEIGEGGRAVADGHRVVIGPDFVGLDYPEPLLAAVLAHELAHNLLFHRAWLDSNGGRKRKTVRLTEREADRLMPWLLANAGYQPEAAARFMLTWGPGNDGWIFRARTHDGWDERVEFIEAELPQIAAHRTADGTVDWREHFRKEDLPGSVAVDGR